MHLDASTTLREGRTVKTEQTYEINEDQRDWLEDMARRHDLPSASKALRVLIDFAIQDCESKEIFEEVRCRHC